MSARRTAVIREQGRRRLRILAIGVAGTVFLAAAWLLLHTPLFGARSVTVTGNMHESAARVIEQAGLAGEPPLLDVDAGATATRLEQLPWVRSASVSVAWPDGVRIKLRVSQRDMSAQVAATRERVNKQLRQWHESGVLAEKDGDLVVRRPAQLRALLDGA